MRWALSALPLLALRVVSQAVLPRCGRDWTSTDATCGQPCEGPDFRCPEEQSCFKDLVTDCSGASSIVISLIASTAVRSVTTSEAEAKVTSTLTKSAVTASARTTTASSHEADTAHSNSTSATTPVCAGSCLSPDHANLTASETLAAFCTLQTSGHLNETQLSSCIANTCSAEEVASFTLLLNHTEIVASLCKSSHSESHESGSAVVSKHATSTQVFASAPVTTTSGLVAPTLYQDQQTVPVAWAVIAGVGIVFLLGLFLVRQCSGVFRRR
ncbi:hypothetical protein BC830DRAFT_1116535 [Chytriomyces sp. MP71]|nr:hypothetical protein BC830DRAFT_1116535 [Chytriomyces sp. MP71]